MRCHSVTAAMICNIYKVKQHSIYSFNKYLLNSSCAIHCVNSWGEVESKDRPHEIYSLMGKKIMTNNYKCNMCFIEIVCCGICNRVLSLGH